MTHHCRTIDLAVRFRLDKAIDKCRNEGCAVAEKDISPLEQAKLVDVVLSEECQVNIACHAKGKQRISGHKPAEH
jgi:hypothetical protein